MDVRVKDVNVGAMNMNAMDMRAMNVRAMVAMDLAPGCEVLCCKDRNTLPLSCHIGASVCCHGVAELQRCALLSAWCVHLCRECDRAW
jgi:hypothetical protein